MTPQPVPSTHNPAALQVLRINPCNPGWEQVQQHLDQTDMATALAWSPERLIWQCADEAYHVCGEFKEWARGQHQLGTVTFQEAMSMVPVVLLAPRPSDTVLDMCACPGSKTTMILEVACPQTVGCTNWCFLAAL